MSRTRTASVRCTYPGCGEVGWFDYDTQREAATIPRDTWRCTRHRHDGNDVLTPDQPALGCVLTLDAARIWRSDTPGAGHSGFVHGPGFKLFGKDWPVGTQVRVSAELLPVEAVS